MARRLYILSFWNDPFSGWTCILWGHIIFVVGCWVGDTVGVGKKYTSFTPSPLSTPTLLHLHLRHASGRQGYTIGSHRTCHAIRWPRLCLQRCRHRARTGPRLHGIGAIGIHLRADGGETELLAGWFFPMERGGKGNVHVLFWCREFLFNPNDNSKYGKHLENMWNTVSYPPPAR